MARSTLVSNNLAMEKRRRDRGNWSPAGRLRATIETLRRTMAARRGRRNRRRADPDHAPAAEKADADLFDLRVSSARPHQCAGTRRPCRRRARQSPPHGPGWCKWRRRRAGRLFAGLLFAAAVARLIAEALISLAWAKAVVSPLTPRRAESAGAVVVGGFSHCRRSRRPADAVP